MVTILYSWLGRPYPLLVDKKIVLPIIGITSLVVFLILVIFRPFGLQEVESIAYLGGFGLCTFITLFIFYFIFPLVFVKFYDVEKWTVGRELVVYFLALTVIITVNYLYNSIVDLKETPDWSYFDFIFMTLAVGAFPMLLLTYITEKVARHKNIEDKNSIAEPSDSQNKKGNSLITIVSKNKTEPHFQIDMECFISAQSTGNYVEIYYEGELDKVQNHLLRITLAELEKQIGNDEFLIRCHKSHIVNKSKVKSIEGNARSCSAIMSSGQEIPISRSFDRTLLE